jgi:phosphatidylethanolamine/phosphatidyl-N-methylethanolamine N-methyltransferase
MRTAYTHLATHYDYLFGPLLRRARAEAIRVVNCLPGTYVLEAGVGTGLALPHYGADKRITGIDLSSAMLRHARNRADRVGLHNVEALLQTDAQATGFAQGRFDIAIAMFVASVVPEPPSLLAELRRVTKPGGSILIVNHFARDSGVLGWCERVAGRISPKLGWRADFSLHDIFESSDIRRAAIKSLHPFGLFQLVVLTN